MNEFKLPDDAVRINPPLDSDVQLGMGPLPGGGVAPQLVVRDEVGTVIVALTAKQLMYLAATARATLMVQAEQIGRLMKENNNDE